MGVEGEAGGGGLGAGEGQCRLMTAMNHDESDDRMSLKESEIDSSTSVGFCE